MVMVVVIMAVAVVVTMVLLVVVVDVVVMLVVVTRAAAMVAIVVATVVMIMINFRSNLITKTFPSPSVCASHKTVRMWKGVHIKDTHVRIFGDCAVNISPNRIDYLVGIGENS